MPSFLLIDEPPLLVQPSLAMLVGLNEALFLQQVHYWLNPRVNKNQKDGYLWVHNTYEQWQQQFPFWGEKTLRRTIGNLETFNILRSYVTTRHFKKTKFYRIDYRALSSLKGAETLGYNPSGQNDQIDLPKSADACGQNDQTEVVNMTRLYKDTKTTEKTTLLLHQRDLMIEKKERQNDDGCEEDEEEKILKKMLSIWHELVQKKLNKKPVFITDQRRRSLSFVFETSFGRDLSQWQAYCHQISEHRFLMGYNDSGFQVSLDWSLQPANVIKVLEGVYYSKPVPQKPEPFLTSAKISDQSKPELPENSYQREWTHLCDHLRQQIDDQTFKSWITPLIPIELSQQRVFLSAGSRLMKEYTEAHLLSALQKALQAVFPGSQEIPLTITDNPYIRTRLGTVKEALQ